MSIFNVFTLFGGLALFLFGMDTMGKSLERQAGSKLHAILEKLTSSPLKGFLLGLVVTAVVQSSSATTVMVVGFVNSGFMSLRQAIGVIMGSNVGTTVTSWILSLAGIEGNSFWIKLLKPSTFSPILALIGIILYMAAKSDKKKNLGTILLGFSILMTGMETMSGAVKPLANVPEFTALFTAFTNPLLGIAIGALLTAVLQSSSASVGILQALSVTGAVTYGSALPIIMGQNIGTCITALISSVGANKNAKRAAIVHLYFNIIGAIVFMVGFYGINYFVQFPFFNDSISFAGIAVIHTFFNIVATAIMLPFAGVLEKLAYLTIKDDEKAETFQILDERLLQTPSIAIEQSKKLLQKMASESANSVLKSFHLFDNWSDELSTEIITSEGIIDKYEDTLGSYLVKISGQELNTQDSHELSKILHIIGDLERISDHSVNIVKIAEEMNNKGISFSDSANKELSVLKNAVEEILTSTTQAFLEDDIHLAQSIEALEHVIEELTREIKTLHIERLKNNNCTIELGFILSDLLTNCKRVADHCSNIAIAVLESKSDGYAPHKYIKTYKKENFDNFNEMVALQKNKYRL